MTPQTSDGSRKTGAPGAPDNAASTQREGAPAWSQETIHWIKRELASSIQDAHDLLERFVEDREQTEVMRRFANVMHTAAGALRMVDIQGATLLVEEMEAVALAIEQSSLANQDDGLDALTRST